MEFNNYSINLDDPMSLTSLLHGVPHFFGARIHAGLQYWPCRGHPLRLFRTVYMPLEYGSPASYDLNYIWSMS